MTSGNHHSSDSNDNSNDSNNDSDVREEVDKEQELENWNGQGRNDTISEESDGGCVNPYVKGLMEKSGLKLLQQRKAKKAFGSEKQELGLFYLCMNINLKKKISHNAPSSSLQHIWV